MNVTTPIFLALRWIVVVAVFSESATAQDTDTLKTDKERESYAVGVDMARNLKAYRIDVETGALLQGMSDVLTGSKLQMTDQDIRKTLRIWQEKVKKGQVQSKSGSGGVAQENLVKGTAFLAANKTKPGVVTLPSGLQYRIIRQGTGKKPLETDTVECWHRDTHIDGREFNSSDRAGQPSIWNLKSGLPAGVKEALLLMPVGSKWQLFVPPQLAYGEKGTAPNRLKGPNVEPNETLVFEVEFLAIK